MVFSAAAVTLSFGLASSVLILSHVLGGLALTAGVFMVGWITRHLAMRTRQKQRVQAQQLFEALCAEVEQKLLPAGNEARSASE